VRRDEALAPLSRDHHQALARALRLKRADEANAADVREDVLAFWREQGDHHFRVEEDVLLPGCAHRIEPTAREVARVLTDHVWIRARMGRLARGDLDLAGMHELGQRLDEHVRHEERVLFPMIEEALELEERRALGSAVADAESAAG
jgi:hemerythrin-like domain-containing protein